MNQDHNHKNSDSLGASLASQAATVIATLVFCFGAFHFYLPQQINQLASSLLPVTETLVANKEDKTKLSQELRDHINKIKESDQNKINQSKSDLAATDLLQDLEQFQEDYSDKASDILSRRFKFPELNSENISEGFTPPEGLEEVVTFWTHIFGVYTKDQVVFYNESYTGIVYSVLDFSELKQSGATGIGGFKSQMIHRERQRIKKMLTKVTKYLEENGRLSDLNAEERRIAKLLEDNKDIVSLKAQDLQSSLKYRNGFAHRIRKALIESGAYLEEMQRIFEERGLPKELTAIPFVESAFNLRAYSGAGAAGIWQFISATGKRYLRIDDFVDERYDPILAAYAAATHLANEYKFLGSWPLTINAYNTGPGRMLQAKKNLGTTDIATIIKKFKGSGYGFDSRNYYPEVLAALHVIQNKEEFFGELKTHPIEKYEYLAMPSPMNVKELSRLAGISRNTIAEMNIGLKPEVLSGIRKLPKGYLIKIPPDAKQDMLVAMQELHRDIKYATHHVVKRGDNLKKIAKLYDISIQELAMANQLLPGQDLKKGTVLRLPGREDFEYSALSEDSEMVVPDKLNVPVF